MQATEDPPYRVNYANYVFLVSYKDRVSAS